MIHYPPETQPESFVLSRGRYILVNFSETIHVTGLKSTFRALHRYQMFGGLTMTTPHPWSDID